MLINGIISWVIEPRVGSYQFLQPDWVFWLFSTEFFINNQISENNQRTVFVNTKQYFKTGLELQKNLVKNLMDFQKTIVNDFVEKKGHDQRCLSCFQKINGFRSNIIRKFRK